jgi:SPP1 family predicted phage head-tail adaptor
MRKHAGSFKKRATIQRRTVSQNSYGEYTETWTTIGTRWIELLPLSSVEILGEPGATPIATHKFALRRWDEIDHATRFLVDGNYYYVASIYDLDCRRVNVGGLCRVEVA